MTCEIGTDIPTAAALLRSGQLVAFGTETVYGLGANALDATAVARIFTAKQRPEFDPLIVHLAHPQRLDEFVQLSELHCEAEARQLMADFWPGPLTLVLPKRDVIPDLVTSGLPTVAVRVPAHPQARDLIAAAGVPVAAPSANLFGRISPTTAEHVADQLGERIDYILDGGACSVGVESTVVDMTGEQPRVLRQGGVTVESLSQSLGRQIEVFKPDEEAANADSAEMPSPGMLSQHYAPVTRLVIIDNDSPEQVQQFAGREHAIGWLSLSAADLPAVAQRIRTETPKRVEILSTDGNLTTAAANFFAALRRLDAGGLELIVATPFPEQDLGRALNDRLRRAATQ